MRLPEMWQRIPDLGDCRRLDGERGVGVAVGGDYDEQRGDGCGDERAAGFGVVVSEHDFYLLIVWNDKETPFTPLFRQTF
jgi:hypothetical protein